MGQGYLPHFIGGVMDFDSILAGIRPQLVVMAICGAAAIAAQIEFALWAAPKVARFFIARGMR